MYDLRERGLRRAISDPSKPEAEYRLPEVAARRVPEAVKEVELALAEAAVEQIVLEEEVEALAGVVVLEAAAVAAGRETS